MWIGKKKRLPVVIEKKDEKKHISDSTLYTEKHDVSMMDTTAKQLQSVVYCIRTDPH